MSNSRKRYPRRRLTHVTSCWTVCSATIGAGTLPTSPVDTSRQNELTSHEKTLLMDLHHQCTRLPCLAIALVLSWKRWSCASWVGEVKPWPRFLGKLRRKSSWHRIYPRRLLNLILGFLLLLKGWVHVELMKSVSMHSVGSCVHQRRNASSVRSQRLQGTWEKPKLALQ